APTMQSVGFSSTCLLASMHPICQSTGFQTRPRRIVNSAGMRTHAPVQDSSHFRTVQATLCGETRAMALCGLLVHASQWFSVMPLPDDQWEVCVKKENEDLLHSWCVTLQQ
ncbi:hypothetical protein, partial [Prosthecobacter vanneervenii]|uniref:hypothetical protein n=1 Tax=Prosthecobacter vanneervenii TaxID=48466 RepID=UPI001C850FD4